MENFVKLNDSIYFHSDTDLYVNQYLSSEVSWKEKNLKLFQETNIPNSDRSKFTIQTLDGNTSDVVIRLRIPDWIAGEALVTVNGQPFQVMEENNYLVLKNTWSDQDVVKFNFLWRLYTTFRIVRIPLLSSMVRLCWCWAEQKIWLKLQPV